MVMRVEVRQGNDSFLSLDEDVQVVLVETNIDIKTSEIIVVNGRDDSASFGRDGSLDNTRQTMNTTFSILDLTKDEEEDDDEEEEQLQSLLFEELQSCDPCHPFVPSAVAAPAFQIPCLNSVTDRFVDSLCHGSSPTCTLPAACYTTPSNSSSRHAPQDRLQVGVYVWELLECTSPIASEAYWTTNTVSSNVLQLAVPAANKVIRTSRQQRKNQLDRWKQQQQLRLIEDVNPTRHGRTTTASPSSVISKAYTMDDMYHRQNNQNQHHHPSSDHHLAHVIGQGIDPILPDGYDSDPEFSFDTARQSASPHSSLMDKDEEEEEEELMDAESEDERIHQMVQETLNHIWTLTWHPNPENLKDHNGSNNKPIAVNIWVERGILIPKTGTVIEPQLKWRDTHQPLLSSCKTLNASTQTPWNLRLLNICGIFPVTNSKIDRNLYPLARANTSFLVRTCQGQDYLLEAPSPKQRKLVCHRWKMAVARFASLAVTEDLDAMSNEFFHPTTTSPMLTVHDDNSNMHAVSEEETSLSHTPSIEG